MPVVEFFERQNGHALAHEFIDSIKDKKVRAAVNDKLEMLEKHGFELDGKFFECIENGLFEFRIKTLRAYVRIFFVYDESMFILTNGVIKKAPQVPNDIQKAKKLMAEYFNQKSKKNEAK